MTSARSNGCTFAGPARARGGTSLSSSSPHARGAGADGPGRLEVVGGGAELVVDGLVVDELVVDELVGGRGRGVDEARAFTALLVTK
jgi:hypothetical protein